MISLVHSPNECIGQVEEAWDPEPYPGLPRGGARDTGTGTCADHKQYSGDWKQAACLLRDGVVSSSILTGVPNARPGNECILQHEESVLASDLTEDLHSYVTSWEMLFLFVLM